MPGLFTCHVNGEMSAGERDKIMDRHRGAFSVASEAAVSNVRCLGEGIDLPEVDAVVFTAPKQSRVEIAQICGRVQRLSKGKDGAPDKVCGYVVIPVFLDLETLEDGTETPGEVIGRTIFGPVFKTLSVISDTDEPFADDVRDLLVAIGRGRHGGNDTWNQRPPLNGLEVIGLDGLPPLTVDLLIREVSLRIAHEIGDPWNVMYGLLYTYWEQHGDCLVPRGCPPDVMLGTWIVNQRSRKDRLSPEQIRKLDEVGFDWDPNDHRWLVMYNRLLAFWEQHGHCNVPGGYDVKLLNWVGVQRTNKDRLSPEQVRKLDAIGFVWDVFSARWEAMFQAAVKFVNKSGHCVMPVNYRDGALRVGYWFNAQRQRYKNNKGHISPDQIRRLTDIGFEWDGRMALWKMRLSELQKYYEQHGDCNVPSGSQLGDWCSTQRQFRRKGTLTTEKIAAIDAIGGGCFEWSRRPPASKDPNICLYGHVGAYRRDSNGVKYCGECRRFKSREKTRMKTIPNYQPGSILGSLHSGAKTHCKLGHPLDGVQKRGDGWQVRYCKTCKLEAGRKRQARLHPEWSIQAGPRAHCKLGHPLDGVSKLRGLFRQRYCKTCRREAMRKHRARIKSTRSAHRSVKTRKLKAGRKRKS